MSSRHATPVVVKSVAGEVGRRLPVPPDRVGIGDERATFHFGDVEVVVRVADERSSGRWATHPTGKVRVSVDVPGGRHGWAAKSFPQRRDWTHDYDAVARAVEARRCHMAERAAEQAAHDANREAARGLAAELGELAGVRVSSSAVPDRPVSLRVDLRADLTVDAARRAVAALLELGLVVA